MPEFDIESTFKNRMIHTLFALINDSYLQEELYFYLHPPGKGYISEVILKSQSNLDDEGKVLYWLWRIQRFFLAPNGLVNKDSKSETAKLIGEFISALEQYSLEIKQCLFKDPRALNCLVISLLMSRNQEHWQIVLALLKQYHPTAVELPLLEWCEAFYFKDAREDYLCILEKIQGIHTEDFKLSASPVSALFSFMALSEWYLKHPTENPDSLLSKLFINKQGNVLFYSLPLVITSSVSALAFTNHFEPVKNMLYTFRNHFLGLFRIPEHSQQLLLEKDTKDQFIAWSIYIIAFCLIEVAGITDPQQLIGLAHLIRFSENKSKEFNDEIFDSSLNLAHTLFDHDLYTEAYELYNITNPFHTEIADGRVLVDWRKPFFCFFARIDQWLNSEDEFPRLSEQDSQFMDKFSSFHKLLTEKEFRRDKQLQLLQRLKDKMKDCKSQQTRICCKHYINSIETNLKNKPLITLKMIPQEKVESVNEEVKIEVASQKPRFVKRKIQRVVPEPAPQIASTEAVKLEPAKVDAAVPKKKERVDPPHPKKVKTKAVPELLKSFPPRQEIYKQHPPKQEIKTKAPAKTAKKPQPQAVVKASTKGPAAVKSPLKSRRQTTRFSANARLPTPMTLFGFIAEQLPAVQSEPALSPSNELVIRKEQIPVKVHQLLNNLLQAEPQLLFFLTGAATDNLLNQITPNDYDILVIGAGQAQIMHILEQQGVAIELRGRLNPVVYCDLGEGVYLDLTVQIKEPEQDLMDFLQRDYLKRDYNLNALYCRLDGGETYPVFSFDHSMDVRKLKIIRSNLPAESSLLQDPCRLFRLAKLLINNPSYELSRELRIVMLKLKNEWIDVFIEYFSKDPANVQRLDLAIRKLFMRYGYEEINLAFDRLNLLECLTANDLSRVSECCSRIPEVVAEEKYIYWMLANMLEYSQRAGGAGLIPMQMIASLYPLEEMLLNLVQEYNKGCVHEKIFQIPQLDSLINGNTESLALK